MGLEQFLERPGWLFRTGKTGETGEFPDWIGIRPAEEGKFVRQNRINPAFRAFRRSGNSGIPGVSGFRRPGNPGIFPPVQLTNRPTQRIFPHTLRFFMILSNFCPILRQFWLIKLGKVTICTRSIKDVALSAIHKSQNFRGIRKIGEFRNSGKSGDPGNFGIPANPANRRRTGVRPAKPPKNCSGPASGRQDQNFFPK